MSVTSPVIFLLCLPLVIYVAWRARRIAVDWARWALHVALAALLLAAAGIELRCDRDARVVVMIDVSPSTRTATFRNADAVADRVRPLLHGRAFETMYFADGPIEGNKEPAARRTRIEPPVADAVVLLSDGQFESPATMPPTFAVTDPALDLPPDAQVSDVEPRGGQIAIATRVEGTPRTLRVSDATPNQIIIAPGDRVTLAQPRKRDITASVTGEDAWPENDALRYQQMSPRSNERWSIGTGVTGYRAIAPGAIPTDPADYLLPSVVVLNTQQPLSESAADRLTQYARELGGTLVLVGPAGALTDPLRSLAPLTARPPEPSPQWVLLLDASGSMDAPTPDGRSRWGAALDAARAALRRLPTDARVWVATFNRSVQWIARAELPTEVDARIDALRNQSPAGPTGLAGALDSAIAPEFATARLLVISDGDAAIGNTQSLSQRLAEHQMQLLALLTNASPAGDAPIAALAKASGGAVLSEADPARWSIAAAMLTQQGLGETADLAAGNAPGSGEIAGLTLRFAGRWSAWARDDAEVVARVRDQPLIATRQAGVGRIVSVVAEANADDLAAIATRLQQPPADPRFVIDWDERNDRVTLTARDRRGPINQLRPVLVRGDVPVPLDQTAPGEYVATLARQAEPTIATVRVGGQIVGRRAIAGRYANEFDLIGNDRRAMKALAERTGGRVIEAGDNTPIDFAGAKEWRSTRAVLSALGAMGVLIAIVLLRAPYLQDLIARAVGEVFSATIKRAVGRMPTVRRRDLSRTR